MFLPLMVVLLLIGLILTVTGQKKPFIWFPSLGSMLKALGLAIPGWLGLVIFPSLFGWLCFLILVLAIKTDAPLTVVIDLTGFGLLSLVGSFFWYWLLVVLYSLVLRLFWSEVPKFLRWLEPPKKKRDILFGWLALSLAALIGVTPFLILSVGLDHPNDFAYSSRGYREYREALERAYGEGALITWFVICAYCYQIRSVYRYTAAKRRKAKQLTT